MKHYVLGFRYNESGILLIQKSKPDWQKGLWNGLGGSVESGETSRMAMVREFAEESGIETLPAEWVWIAQMNGDDWKMDVYASHGGFSGLKESCDEGTLQVWDHIPHPMERTADWLVGMITDTSIPEMEVEFHKRRLRR